MHIQITIRYISKNHSRDSQITPKSNYYPE
jgi:hypothetical protein